MFHIYQGMCISISSKCNSWSDTNTMLRFTNILSLVSDVWDKIGWDLANDCTNDKESVYSYLASDRNLKATKINVTISY